MTSPQDEIDELLTNCIEEDPEGNFYPNFTKLKPQLKALVDSRVAEARSECCGGDLVGVGGDPADPTHFICSECKQPCKGTTKW